MSEPTTVSQSQRGPSGNQYVVALLALWAGDTAGARVRLEAITKMLDQKPRNKLFEEDPHGTSALRTLDQLNRRSREFASLLGSAGQAENAIKSNMCVLQSAGGHLTGVVWSQADREFDLRVYVNDLEWEEHFYGATFRRASAFNVGQTKSRPLYEKRDSTFETSLAPEGQRTLNQTWAETGELLIRVEVSDFCTFTARGLWTAKALPQKQEMITTPFQDLLNGIDGDNKA